MSIESIVATATAILLAILGLVVNGYRQRISELENELKEIREKYVRRDDLNGHITSMQKTIDEVKNDVKELTKLVIAAIQSTKRN